MKVKTTIVMETENFEIGDVISFTLKNGEEVKAMAADITDEETIFIYVDLLPDYHPMNSTNTTAGGWDECELRKWLHEEYLPLFPAEMLDRMAVMKSGDILRIPTEKEIFGYNRVAMEREPEEVKQFKVMEEPRNRIAMFKDELSDWYWLQNPASASWFAFVDGTGGADVADASHAWVGVRPLFLLSKNRTADRR